MLRMLGDKRETVVLNGGQKDTQDGASTYPVLYPYGIRRNPAPLVTLRGGASLPAS